MVMPVLCQLGSFYKVFVALIIGLIALDYIYNSYIDTKPWETIAFNVTKSQLPKTSMGFKHPPLIKGFAGTNTEISVMETKFTSTISKSKNNLTIVTEIFTIETHSSTVNVTTIPVNEDVTTEVLTVNTTTTPMCPETPPDLRGRLDIIKHPIPSAAELQHRFSWLKPGGHWFPENCRVPKRVAIIVPFRCRGEHLLIFLQHMHPLLRKQRLDYTIFIIEQEGSGAFNRAMLMNIGYKEALRLYKYDCFIFHDVDLLPEDDRNLYTCPEQPRHMSVGVDIFKYRLPYTGIFGGVSAISREHFQLLNGFSNSFWGWGGEDDDMSNRIRYHKLHISRYPISIARYTMLHHKKDKPSPNRYDILKSGQKKFNTDGLSNLKYTLKKVRKLVLYTWILVELEPPS